VNHILKVVVLSSALALCVMLFGFSNGSASGVPKAEASSSPAPSAVSCSTFCRNEGGPFYLNLGGVTTEATCTSRGGDFFPDNGCCCKCSEPGRCL